MGNALLQASAAKNAEKRLDPLSNMINNVVSAMSRYLGIQIDGMREFIISSTIVQMKTVKSRELYEKEAAAFKASKKKDKDPYDVYYNQRILLITLAFLFISIQTAIPSVRTKKSHPGCVKSFSGAPLDGDDDLTGITYIACTAFKIKSAIEPWNGIKNMKDKIVAANMKLLINAFVERSSDLKVKFQEKREYLLINENEEIPAKLDIKRWINFLPPLVKLEQKTPQNITPGLKNSLLESIKKGTKKQHEDILIIKSKIIEFSIGIQKGIQSVVDKEHLILSSASGPYLQNACCYSNNMTPIAYMNDRNKTIAQYNTIVKDLRNIILDMRSLSQAPYLFDPSNTRVSYPEIPPGFDEPTIYMAFIRFCNYLNKLPLSENLRRICGVKPEFLNNGQSLEEHIELLKKEGYNFTTEKMDELVAAVLRENQVDIDMVRVVVSPVEEYQSIIQYVQEAQEESGAEEDAVLPPQFITMMKKVVDSGERFVSNTDTDMRILRNHVSKTNERMVLNIMEYLKGHTKLSKRDLLKKKEFMNSLLDFDDINNKDDQLMRMVLFAKNTIRNTGMVFPNMILNQVDYEEIKIPVHWKFSEIHNAKLCEFLQSHYNDLRRYYGEKTLAPLMASMGRKLETLVLVEKSLPIIRDSDKMNGKDALFDERTLKGIYKYFILSIFELIMSLSSETELIVQEVVPFSEDMEIMSGLQAQEEATGQITEIEILVGEKKSLDEKLASLMGVFLGIVEKDKKSIDYNENKIRENITRAKDREKDDIVEELGGLLQEERDVQNIFKKHRMERWSRGSGHKYTGDAYDRDNAEMEQRETRREQLAQTEGVSDRNINIIEMEDQEQAHRDAENDAEELALDHLPEDDDYGNQDDFND